MKKIKWVVLFTLVAFATVWGAEPKPVDFDMDKDGKWSKDEFLALQKARIEARGNRYFEGKQLIIFNYKDEDKDGYLTADELKKLRAPSVG